VDETVRACSTHCGKEECIYGFGGEEGKRLLGRHRRRWKNNIKMDVKGIGTASVV
jgi:hypothetical protein